LEQTRPVPSIIMTSIRKSVVALVLSLAGLSLSSCSDSSPIRLPLSVRGNIQLPPETGGRVPLFDLLTVDERRGLLYVPHTSNSTLEIVDTKTQKFVITIPGLAGARGVALTPDPNIVFVSMSGGGAVAEVDTKAMKVVGTIAVNGSPDAVGYDPVNDVVLATSSGSKELNIINRTTRKVTSTVKLPGSPELLTVDPKAGVAYIAINDKDEVAAVDIATQQLTELRGCDIKAPTGVALDDQGHLFVADRGLVSVIDVLIDKCLGSVDIGNGVDQIAVSLHTHHLYTANGGSRNLSVIDTRTFKPLGEVGTGPGGDGVAVDSATDLVYVMVGRPGVVTVFHDP
jgi:DNA-binding beta-propeller fold protein YncE